MTINENSTREEVLEALEANQLVLQFVNRELRRDEGVVLEAVKRNGLELEFASQELKENTKVVLAAVKQNGYSLQYASKEVKANREVVLAAVKKAGNALRFASEKLRSNKEIVLTAVNQSGIVFKFASKKLQSDPDIVSAAYKNYLRLVVAAGDDLNQTYVLYDLPENIAKEFNREIDKWRHETNNPEGTIKDFAEQRVKELEDLERGKLSGDAKKKAKKHIKDFYTIITDAGPDEEIELNFPSITTNSYSTFLPKTPNQTTTSVPSIESTNSSPGFLTGALIGSGGIALIAGAVIAKQCPKRNTTREYIRAESSAEERRGGYKAPSDEVIGASADAIELREGGSIVV